MGNSTNKQVFDTLYSRFGKDIWGNQLLDWDWFIHAYPQYGKQYYVWADLTPKIPTDRIPYYKNLNDYFRGVSKIGYLPANLSGYYFKMRPISLETYSSVFYKYITGSYLSLKNLLTFQFTAIRDAIDMNKLRSMKAVARVHFFDRAKGGYVSYFVPLNQTNFDIKYFATPIEKFEQQKNEIIALNNEVVRYAKAASLQYNKSQLVLNHKNFSNLKPEIKTKARLAYNDAFEKIYDLSNDPMILAKRCAECAKNAKVSGIGIAPVVLVVLIAAVAIGGTITVAALIKSREKLQTQRIQSDRINNDLAKYYEALNNPNLSAAEKAEYLQLIKGDIKAAQETIDKSQSEPGFWGRLENLIFLAGGILILNNVTKKEKV